MILNGANLKTVFTALNTRFEMGLAEAPTDHDLFTSEVPSTTGEEEYPWLAQFPGMRKWVGDREIRNLSSFVYRLKNEDWEDTLEVPSNTVEDDKWGGFGMSAQMLGRAGASHPCELAYAGLKAGTTTPCYDGQNFFDANHPVLAANGAKQLVSNYQAGGGPLWVLMCTKSYIKPLILQRRQALRFVAKDQPTDDNVFHGKKLLYGIDDRKTIGYSFWQLAYGSNAPLTLPNYIAARQAIMSVTGDGGRPLGLIGDTLLVSPANEDAGRKVVKAPLINAGETNVWAGTAELAVSSWFV